jgi:hypothetical protein
MKKAIIVDLDGTLVNGLYHHHLWFATNPDYDLINRTVMGDQPNEWCRDMVESLSKLGYFIIYLTARDARSKTGTQNWINNNLTTPNGHVLIMRQEGDTRPDWIIKEELYRSHILGQYDVQFAIDDKQCVTDMWRRNGITALQCDDKA